MGKLNGVPQPRRLRNLMPTSPCLFTAIGLLATPWLLNALLTGSRVL